MGSLCSSNIAARVSRSRVSARFSRRFTSIAYSWKPGSIVRRHRMQRSIAATCATITSAIARHAEVGSDPVDDEALGGGLEVVEHVVEAGREVVDVLAVERRDEGRVQPFDDLVRDLVARVLDLFDRVRLGPGVGEGVDQLLEEAGGLDDVPGLLLEVVEEPDFFRDQVEHGTTANFTTPCGARGQAVRGARAGRRSRAPRAPP